MSDDRTEFARQLAGMLAASRERSELAGRMHAYLKAERKLASHRVLTYRCSRRCLLLDIFVTPAGAIAHSPRYKLSPKVNEEASSAEGRAKNTEDGERKWKARTYFVQDAGNFSINCDHLHHVVLELDDVQADLDAGRSEVTIPPRR